MGLLELLVRGYLMARRFLSVGIALLGAVILWNAYPPHGTDAFVPLFIGGILLLLGLVGVVDPSRTTPSGGGHSD